MLAAPQGAGAPVKWIEDRRENLLAAGQVAPRARRRARWPSTPTATILAAHIDSRPGLRRLPDAVAGRHRGRRRHAVPRARTACPTAAFTTQGGLHEHRRAHRVPRAVAVRVARPRGAARHRGAPDGHRPGRAAPPQPAAPRRAAVHATRTACPTTASRRSRRSSRRSAMLDYDAFRARAGRGPRGRPLPRRRHCRTTSSRRRRATGYYATEGATIRIEPSGTVNVYVAGGSTGNSLETTVVQLAADALGVDIDDVNTIQGDTAVTGVRRRHRRAAAAGR